jgi:hypothetical protein
MWTNVSPVEANFQGLGFTLTGQVGRIRPCAGETLIAVSSKRLLQNGAPELRWVTCAARDTLLRALIERRLHVGDVARIEGEIEPRRREIKGVAFYDVVFVARIFEKLEKLPSPPEARP